MNDYINDTGEAHQALRDEKRDEMLQSDPKLTAKYGEDLAEKGADQIGFFANLIRSQPLISLSLAFGLGLLATSVLARQKK